jgi:hypothetical protein
LSPPPAESSPIHPALRQRGGHPATPIADGLRAWMNPASTPPPVSCPGRQYRRCFGVRFEQTSRFSLALIGAVAIHVLALLGLALSISFKTPKLLVVEPQIVAVTMPPPRPPDVETIGTTDSPVILPRFRPREPLGLTPGSGSAAAIQRWRFGGTCAIAIQRLARPRNARVLRTCDRWISACAIRSLDRAMPGL